MKRLFKLSLSVIFLAFFWASCQREIFFDVDRNSDGFLAKDGSGNCLPIQVGGTYIQGQNVGDTNFLLITVKVNRKGNYSIVSDTVNGLHFQATGSFSDTGSRQVKLPAFGNPLAAGTNTFQINYDSTICTATLTVKANLNGQADLTLDGAPSACMNAVVAGGYSASSELDTSNKVIINVNVLTPGAYSISTNTVNGYSFSGSGTLANAGSQTITLAASGSPIAIGANVFSVTVGTSSCTFTVNINAAVAVTNNDYFPLTQGSHWTYDDLFRPGDSVRRSVDGNFSVGPRIYVLVNEQAMFGGPKPLYFRKIDSEYLEYGRVDKYTNAVEYAVPFEDDMPLLKEGLTTGDAWNSDEFNALSDFGQIIVIQYQYFCLNANAALTVNGITFSNVYKIMMKPRIRTEIGSFGYTGEIFTQYYAKGIGLVYAKYTRDGFTLYEWQIRNNWLVN